MGERENRETGDGQFQSQQAEDAWKDMILQLESEGQSVGTFSSFLGAPVCFFSLMSSTNWIRFTCLMNTDMIYSKSSDLNINLEFTDLYINLKSADLNINLI